MAFEAMAHSLVMGRFPDNMVSGIPVFTSSMPNLAAIACASWPEFNPSSIVSSSSVNGGKGLDKGLFFLVGPSPR
jgi:hypothetical protein